MNKKTPITAVKSKSEKKPVCIVDTLTFHDRHPAWRFARLKHYNDSEFGWSSMEEQMFYIISKLHDIEVQKWSDIFKNSKQHHHINVTDLIPEVQRLLQKKREDIEQVFSIHISARERLFGIIESGVGIVDIIWWDPQHKICPSHKKHT
ncbi:MAG: hypothetical protein E7054_06990 [Lentisphaerae bacterium]|nr:hypothetical protein [Lentisphaerota bacterium]